MDKVKSAAEKAATGAEDRQVKGRSRTPVLHKADAPPGASAT
jgi:hypothetical protein